MKKRKEGQWELEEGGLYDGKLPVVHGSKGLLASQQVHPDPLPHIPPEQA